MQLRDHPILKVFDGFHWWPPIWTNDQKRLRGELGILVKAEFRPYLPTLIFMWISHEDEAFIGALHVRNEALCRQLHILIAQNIGKTITQIGDLEVDFLL